MKTGSPRVRRTGATAIEFALVFPVFLTFLFGIVEYGWFMSRQAIVVSAAQEGGRAAVAAGLVTAGAAEAAAIAKANLTLQAGAIALGGTTVTAVKTPAGAVANGVVTVTVLVPDTGLTHYLPVPNPIRAVHQAFVPY